MKILFLHGWHSVPGGLKPTFLVEQGCEVSNPLLSDDDFDAAVCTAQAEFDRQSPDCIVGSSRGGAVALNIQSAGVPLVLLCPAWKRWGQNKTIRSRAAILHSRADDVIPFKESQELIVRSRLPSDTLIEVGRDHRLADEDSLAALWWACKLVASPDELPSLDDEPKVGNVHLRAMKDRCRGNRAMSAMRAEKRSLFHWTSQRGRVKSMLRTAPSAAVRT